jgi:hypothetical protein
MATQLMMPSTFFRGDGIGTKAGSSAGLLLEASTVLVVIVAESLSKFKVISSNSIRVALR